MRASTTILSLAALLACEAPAPLHPLPEPDEASLARAGDGPVSGAIAGEEFAAIDVRMRVVEGAGRARVDLLFSDRPIERCGLPIVRSERLVWLRLSGRTSLEVETLARTEAEQPFELHYEVPAGEGGLRSEHRGLATLAVDRVAPDRIEGRLRACFADAERSCVGGRFVARPCLSRINGRMAREPPGLVDEALEPTALELAPASAPEAATAAPVEVEPGSVEPHASADPASAEPSGASP